MQAEVRQTEHGYQARYERILNHGTERVWGLLTENEQLKQWFPELKVEELKKGGYISFDLGDGSYEKMNILEFEEGKELAFEWEQGDVHFELLPAEFGSELKMIESFPKITPQTAKDLAGWHVCLDVIEALLEGRQIDRNVRWEKEFEEYKRLLDSLSINFE